MTGDQRVVVRILVVPRRFGTLAISLTSLCLEFDSDTVTLTVTVSFFYFLPTVKHSNLSKFFSTCDPRRSPRHGDVTCLPTKSKLLGESSQQITVYMYTETSDTFTSRVGFLSHYSVIDTRIAGCSDNLPEIYYSK